MKAGWRKACRPAENTATMKPVGACLPHIDGDLTYAMAVLFPVMMAESADNGRSHKFDRFLGSSGKRVPAASVSGPACLILHGVPSGLESSGSHHRWLKPPALILFPSGEPGTPKGLCRIAGDFSHRKRIPTVPVVL